MLKPKQLFINIYFNVCVKRVYPHKTNNNIMFRYEKIQKNLFSVPFAMIEFESPAVINCAVNKSKQFAILKINIFSRTSTLRLRQNGRERAISMVQTGITHQAIIDHFIVSRIAISSLMIRLLQTGRTNDIPCSDRPRMTSQPQDRYLRLIHHRNHMIRAGDTTRRTPGLANVRISGQTDRRRLPES